MPKRAMAASMGMLTLVTAGAAALGVTATAATAGVSPSRRVVHDGLGDVWRRDLSSGELVAVNGHPTSDVVRVVARHAAGAVVVRFRFVDLRRVGQQQTQAAFIKTPRRLYLARVNSGPGDRRGSNSLSDWGPPASGSTIRCVGDSHRIEYSADVVIVRVPRDCLRRPRWVKVKAFNYTVYGSFDEGAAYMDNPHNDQSEPDRFTRRLYRR